MKITILDTIPGEETDHYKMPELHLNIQKSAPEIKNRNTKIAGYNENGIHLLERIEIYIFETVDNKVFACCKKEVYEVREKLYTLEGMLPSRIVYIERQSLQFKSQQSKKVYHQPWQTF